MLFLIFCDIWLAQNNKIEHIIAFICFFDDNYLSWEFNEEAWNQKWVYSNKKLSLEWKWKVCELILFSQKMKWIILDGSSCSLKFKIFSSFFILF
jgi:hypothetical protein